jgi:MraZ protein
MITILNTLVVESGGRWRRVIGFSGKHYKSLDSKGRLIIPAPFREILSSNHSSKLIITLDAFDPCICAYPATEWQKLVDTASRLPQTDDSVKFYMRRVVGSAVECEIDKQGRVLVSPALRVDAGLDGEVVILGLGTKLEIWDRSRHEDFADPARIDLPAFKERLAGFGL